MTLPVAKHLFDSTWLIVSKESLKFALVCNGQHTELQTKPPLDVIRVESVCIASNKYFSLMEPFVVGKSNVSHENYWELKTANFSHSMVWRPLNDKFPNVSNISIPTQLIDIKDLPLDNLITQLELSTDTEFDSNSDWTF